MGNPNRPTVILIMVMSANGVVAQKEIENSFDWNSREDRIQFLDRIKDIGTVIMGSNTYRSIGSQPYDGTDFYVLTSRPDSFAPQKRVTFVSGDVLDIYSKWQEKGLRKIALLGGPGTNQQFLQNDLVDEIYLTIEPVIMPEGLHLTSSLADWTQLRLNRVEPLNEQKTLLLHYSVLKNGPNLKSDHNASSTVADSNQQ